MSYTKQTWQAGDEITSAKLNHMEDGINDAVNNNDSGGYLALHDINNTLDKTWKEIHDAFIEGKYVCVVMLRNSNEISHVHLSEISFDGEEYKIETNYKTYTTNSENGYPASFA